MNESASVIAQEDASRGARFFAATIDGLIISAFTMPLSYALGLFEDFGNFKDPKPVPMGPFFLVVAVGFALFFAINGQLLSKYAQTVGKRMQGIRVVTLDGSKPSLQHLLLKRYVPYFGFAYVPFIGFFLNLMNLCWIFGREKRCLHDRIAGTRVVRDA